MQTLHSKIRKSLVFVKKNRIALIVLGFASLIWFLLRVIPKPQRASYPCQRAAFPFASAFVIWVSGFLISRNLYFKAFYAENKWKASLVMLSAVIVLVISLFFSQISGNLAMAISQLKTNALGSELLAKELSSTNESVVTAQSIVGITRSDKANATEIEFNEVDSLIRAAVKLAGGFDTLIHEGDTVVIKPNVIASKDQKSGSFKTFPMTSNGIATDYRVIQVVVNMVREKNTTGKIYMIEGSGYGYTRKNMDSIGYNKVTGIDSIVYLDEFTGKWYDKSASDIVKVSLPKGKNLYSSANEYFLHKIYARAQVLISLPCLKTHFLTGVTGSVKNVGIGATPVRIYGNGTGVPVDDQSGRWNHINHGDFSTTTVSLDKWIHDFYMCRKVDYVIMDGLQGAQYGPYPSSSGDNRALNDVQMNMRVILAGKDPLAVDAIEALSIGMDPYKVGHLVLLANDTIGCINPAFIKIKGPQLASFRKLFGENAPGNKCMYKDLTAPAAKLTGLKYENGKILANLSDVQDVFKVEFEYNDSIFEEIVVKNFENMEFPATNISDINKANVYVYDKYLNYNILSLANPVQTRYLNQQKIGIHPNPATSHLNIQNHKLLGSEAFYNIISLKGQNLGQGKVSSQLEIASLVPGQYFLKIIDGNNQYSLAFIKK